MKMNKNQSKIREKSVGSISLDQSNSSLVVGISGLTDTDVSDDQVETLSHGQET